MQKPCKTPTKNISLHSLCVLGLQTSSSSVGPYVRVAFLSPPSKHLLRQPLALAFEVFILRVCATISRLVTWTRCAQPPRYQIWAFLAAGFANDGTATLHTSHILHSMRIDDA